MSTSILISTVAVASIAQTPIQVPALPSRSAVTPALRIEDRAVPGVWCPNGPVSDVEFDGDTIYVSGEFETFGRYTGPLALLDPGTGNVQFSPFFIEGSIDAICDDGAGGWFVTGPLSIPQTSSYGFVRLRADGSAEVYSATGAVSQVNVLVRDGSTLYIGGRFMNAFGVQRRGLAALDITTDTLLPFDPISPIASGIMTEVHDIAVIGNELIVCGQVGIGAPGAQVWRSLVSFDRVTGAVLWQPDINGLVYALDHDNDYIFLGGSFNSVLQAPRANLASVRRSDRGITSFTPAMDGWVGTLLRSGDRLFVGGGFSNVGGNPRSRIASFDVAANALTSWNPDVVHATGAGDDVLDLAEVGNAIAVVGSFRSVAGARRSCFALVDRDIPLALAQRADVDSNDGPAVTSVAVANGVLAIGGRFSIVGQSYTPGIAALDARTGRTRPAFQPDLESRFGIGVPASVGDIIVRNDKLVVVGTQYKVDGVTRKHVAAIDKVTGRLIPSFNAGFDGPPNGMWIDHSLDVGSQIYIVGAFDTPDPGFSDFVALNPDNGQLVTSFRPALQGRVYTLARSSDGTTLFAGGPPFSAGSPLEPRDRLAAFDATTGALLPWNPGANNSVWTMHVFGNRLYVGGAFSTVAGQARPRLVAFDVPSGQLLPWHSGITGGEVYTVERFLGDTLVGGLVDMMGGAMRRGCGALHTQLGVALPWNPDPGNSVSVIRTGPRAVAVGGSFRATPTFRRQYFALYPINP